MISFEEAYTIVIESAQSLGYEHVDLFSSLNRVLFEDVVSDDSMPPFNKSAVDGFACRRSDLGNELAVVEDIPAGVAPVKKLMRNQCARIMTGSMVPEGADIVIMVEQTEGAGPEKIRFTGKQTAANICYTGEDIKTGDVVLRKGTLIAPQHIAVMASTGYISPRVFRQPCIGIISTGDELVEPDHKPEISQIRNSNASQLLAQIRQLGIEGSYKGIARDKRKLIRDRIFAAMKHHDMILITGGVSMGAYDFVPGIMEELGFRLQFKSIAIQPGKPTVFGLREKQYIFGLPGNPVSSFVLFEMLVKPMVYKLMGHDYSAREYRLPMGENYIRKRSARKSLLPVNISEKGEVFPADYHGSAHIHAYTSAKGIVIIDIGVTHLKKGEMVNVRQI